MPRGGVAPWVGVVVVVLVGLATAAGAAGMEAGSGPAEPEPAIPSPEPRVPEPQTPDAPVEPEASARVDEDGEANASASASLDDGPRPPSAAAWPAPEPNASAEAGAAALPDPGNPCEESPLARLQAGAVVAAGGPPGKGKASEAVEDPRDHPALDCLEEADPATAGAPGEPATAAAAVVAGPAARTSVPASAPTMEPPERQGSREDPPDRGGEAVGVDAVARGTPQGVGLTPGATALALAALAVPAAGVLYRRLTRDGLLENDTRAGILKLVRERPGVTPSEVRDALDVHYRTVRHHLDVLEEFGEVEPLEAGGRIRYFEAAGDLDDVAKRLVASLSSTTKRDVLMTIARRGAVRSGEVADAVDVAPSTASHHLGDLSEDDLVARRRKGREVLYSLEDGVLPALIDLAPTPGDGEAP